MELLLIFLFIVLNNVGWLLYSDRRDKREKDERRELLNRVAEPEIVVPPDEVVKANVKAAQSVEPFEPADSFEYAAIGNISPQLAREDGKE